MSSFQQTDYDQERDRYYYASDNPLVIVVCWGFELSDVAGRVRDASIGTHEGKYGAVLQHNLSYQHTKITLKKIVNTPAQTQWQNVIANAPKKKKQNSSPSGRG